MVSWMSYKLYLCCHRRRKQEFNIESVTDPTHVVPNTEEAKDTRTPTHADAEPNREMDTRAPTPTAAEIQTISLEDRTFANSNYKRFYVESQAPLFQHDLLHSVNEMLKRYAKRTNPALDQQALLDGVNGFMMKIQDDAFRNNEALQNDVLAVAEYLWTSGKTHNIVNGMELCSVLNAVIRGDVADEIQAAIIIFRSINSRRVARKNNHATIDEQSYPKKGETWRGGGFRNEFQPFFEKVKGKKYRVPGYLATSNQQSVAAAFSFKVGKLLPRAMWRITFDKRGKNKPQYRVQHMSFVSKTLIPGEHEYLFAPYSVFTLVSVEWSSEWIEPHEFTLKAARDNMEEDENLPLTPWY